MKTIFWSLEQFSYDLEMKTREQNKNNKRAKIKRFDWFIERIQTHLWLVKRTLCWKNFMPEELSRNRFDVILQHDWSIEQCLLHIRVFFGGKTKSPCFVLFIHWLIKQITNTYGNHFSRSYENRSMQMKPPYTWKWGSWKPGMDYSLFYSFRLLEKTYHEVFIRIHWLQSKSAQNSVAICADAV